MAVEDLDLQQRVGVFFFAQKLVNAHSGALAVGYAVNDQTRAEDAITAGKDARDRGHQILTINRDEAALRDFDLAVIAQEIQIWRLANGENHGVTVDQRLAAGRELRTEPALLVKNAARTHGFQSSHPAVFPDHLAGPDAGMNDDTLGFRFFDFFQRGRNLIAALDADDVHLAGAHAQRRERNINHLMRSDGGEIFGPVFRLHLMLAHHFAGRGASHVHGDVAAADHHNLFADRELVAKVHVQQKIDAFMNAIEIYARN